MFFFASGLHTEFGVFIQFLLFLMVKMPRIEADPLSAPRDFFISFKFRTLYLDDKIVAVCVVRGACVRFCTNDAYANLSQ